MDGPRCAYSPSFARHLGGFHLSATVENAAMNTGGQGSLRPQFQSFAGSTQK